MFSVRLVKADHYMNTPIPGLDVRYSEFRASEVKQVPVIRIFGSSTAGHKVCLHIHGVFPYFYIPYDGSVEKDRFRYQIAAALDKAINISLGNSNSKTQHVYKISLVSGIPLYGYHSKAHQFLKIFLYNPLLVKKAADLVQSGVILGQVFQPHEAHVPFILQFCIDYNIHGMSLVHLSAVRYRHVSEGGVQRHRTLLDNVPEELILPDSVVRISTCALEVDGMAVDILNQRDITGNLSRNPGLKAIWDEEHERRRTKLQSSQTVSQQSSQIRPAVSSTDSEAFHLERLKKRLAQLASLQVIAGPSLDASPLGEKPRPYPAETPESENLLEASVLETHVSSLSNNTPNSRERLSGNQQEELDDIFVDRDVVLSLPTNEPNEVPQSLDDSVLSSQALSLVQMLQELVEEDSVLGSQGQGPERMESGEESEGEGDPTLTQSIRDLEPHSDTEEAEKGVPFSIPQLDGANDVLGNEELPDSPKPGPSGMSSHHLQMDKISFPTMMDEDELEEISLAFKESVDCGTSLAMELIEGSERENCQKDIYTGNFSAFRLDDACNPAISIPVGCDSSSNAEYNFGHLKPGEPLENYLISDPWMTSAPTISERDELLESASALSTEDLWTSEEAEGSLWPSDLVQTTLPSVEELGCSLSDLSPIKPVPSLDCSANSDSANETKRRLNSLIKSRRKARKGQNGESDVREMTSDGMSDREETGGVSAVPFDCNFGELIDIDNMQVLLNEIVEGDLLSDDLLGGSSEQWPEVEPLELGREDSPPVPPDEPEARKKQSARTSPERASLCDARRPQKVAEDEGKPTAGRRRRGRPPKNPQIHRSGLAKEEKICGESVKGKLTADHGIPCNQTVKEKLGLHIRSARRSKRNSSALQNSPSKPETEAGVNINVKSLTVDSAVKVVESVELSDVQNPCPPGSYLNDEVSSSAGNSEKEKKQEMSLFVRQKLGMFVGTRSKLRAAAGLSLLSDAVEDKNNLEKEQGKQDCKESDQCVEKCIRFTEDVELEPPLQRNNPSTDFLKLHSIYPCFVKLERCNENGLSKEMCDIPSELVSSETEISVDGSGASVESSHEKGLSEEFVSSETVCSSHRYDQLRPVMIDPSGLLNFDSDHGVSDIITSCVIPKISNGSCKGAKKAVREIGSLKAVIQAESPRVADTLDSLPENPLHGIRHYAPRLGTILGVTEVEEHGKSASQILPMSQDLLCDTVSESDYSQNKTVFLSDSKDDLNYFQDYPGLSCDATDLDELNEDLLSFTHVQNTGRQWESEDSVNRFASEKRKFSECVDDSEMELLSLINSENETAIQEEDAAKNSCHGSEEENLLGDAEFRLLPELLGLTDESEVIVEKANPDMTSDIDVNINTETVTLMEQVSDCQSSGEKHERVIPVHHRGFPRIHLKTQKSPGRKQSHNGGFDSEKSLKEEAKQRKRASNVKHSDGRNEKNSLLVREKRLSDKKRISLNRALGGPNVTDASLEEPDRACKNLEQLASLAVSKDSLSKSASEFSENNSKLALTDQGNENWSVSTEVTDPAISAETDLKKGTEMSESSLKKGRSAREDKKLDLPINGHDTVGTDDILNDSTCDRLLTVEENCVGKAEELTPPSIDNKESSLKKDTSGCPSVAVDNKDSIDDNLLKGRPNVETDVRLSSRTRKSKAVKDKELNVSVHRNGGTAASGISDLFLEKESELDKDLGTQTGVRVSSHTTRKASKKDGKILRKMNGLRSSTIMDITCSSDSNLSSVPVLEESPQKIEEKHALDRKTKGKKQREIMEVDVGGVSDMPAENNKPERSKRKMEETLVCVFDGSEKGVYPKGYRISRSRTSVHKTSVDIDKSDIIVTSGTSDVSVKDSESSEPKCVVPLDNERVVEEGRKLNRSGERKVKNFSDSCAITCVDTSERTGEKQHEKRKDKKALAGKKNELEPSCISEPSAITSVDTSERTSERKHERRKDKKALAGKKNESESSYVSEPITSVDTSERTSERKHEKMKDKKALAGKKNESESSYVSEPSAITSIDTSERTSERKHERRKDKKALAGKENESESSYVSEPSAITSVDTSERTSERKHEKTNDKKALAGKKNESESLCVSEPSAILFVDTSERTSERKHEKRKDKKALAGKENESESSYVSEPSAITSVDTSERTSERKHEKTNDKEALAGKKNESESLCVSEPSAILSVDTSERTSERKHERRKDKKALAGKKNESESLCVSEPSAVLSVDTSERSSERKHERRKDKKALAGKKNESESSCVSEPSAILSVDTSERTSERKHERRKDKKALAGKKNESESLCVSEPSAILSVDTSERTSERKHERRKDKKALAGKKNESESLCVSEPSAVLSVDTSERSSERKHEKTKDKKALADKKNESESSCVSEPSAILSVDTSERTSERKHERRKDKKALAGKKNESESSYVSEPSAITSIDTSERTSERKHEKTNDKKALAGKKNESESLCVSEPSAVLSVDTSERSSERKHEKTKDKKALADKKNESESSCVSEPSAILSVDTSERTSERKHERRKDKKALAGKKNESESSYVSEPSAVLSVDTSERSSERKHERRKDKKALADKKNESESSCVSEPSAILSVDTSERTSERKHERRKDKKALAGKKNESESSYVSEPSAITSIDTSERTSERKHEKTKDKKALFGKKNESESLYVNEPSAATSVNKSERTSERKHEKRRDRKALAGKKNESGSSFVCEPKCEVKELAPSVKKLKRLNDDEVVKSSAEVSANCSVSANSDEYQEVLNSTKKSAKAKKKTLPMNLLKAKNEPQTLLSNGRKSRPPLSRNELISKCGVDVDPKLSNSDRDERENVAEEKPMVLFAASAERRKVSRTSVTENICAHSSVNVPPSLCDDSCENSVQVPVKRSKNVGSGSLSSPLDVSAFSEVDSAAQTVERRRRLKERAPCICKPRSEKKAEKISRSRSVSVSEDALKDNKSFESSRVGDDEKKLFPVLERNSLPERRNLKLNSNTEDKTNTALKEFSVNKGAADITSKISLESCSKHFSETNVVLKPVRVLVQKLDPTVVNKFHSSGNVSVCVKEDKPSVAVEEVKNAVGSDSDDSSSMPLSLLVPRRSGQKNASQCIDESERSVNVTLKLKSSRFCRRKSDIDAKGGGDTRDNDKLPLKRGVGSVEEGLEYDQPSAKNKRLLSQRDMERKTRVRQKRILCVDGAMDSTDSDSSESNDVFRPKKIRSEVERRFCGTVEVDDDISRSSSESSNARVVLESPVTSPKKQRYRPLQVLIKRSPQKKQSDKSRKVPKLLYSDSSEDSVEMAPEKENDAMHEIAFSKFLALEKEKQGLELDSKMFLPVVLLERLTPLVKDPTEVSVKEGTCGGDPNKSNISVEVHVSTVCDTAAVPGGCAAPSINLTDFGGKFLSNAEEQKGSLSKEEETCESVLHRGDASSCVTYQKSQKERSDIKDSEPSRKSDASEGDSVSILSLSKKNIVNSESSQEESGDGLSGKESRDVVITLKAAPPSATQLLNSLTSLNIPRHRFLLPYFSVASDSAEQKEVGGRNLRVPSSSTTELDSFKSTLPNIMSLGEQRDETVMCVLGPTQSDGNGIVHLRDMKAALAGQGETVVSLCRCAPSVSDVKQWAKARSVCKEFQKEERPTEKVEKLVFMVPASPGSDISGEEETCVSLTPLSQNSFVEKTLIPEDNSNSSEGQVSKMNEGNNTMIKSQHFTSSGESEKQAEIKTSGESNSSLLRLAAQTQFRQQFDTPRAGNRSVRSNDSIDFKMSYENLQEARALVEHQYLTLIVLELHVQTRGELRPDPTYDPVGAVFYAVRNDYPEDSFVPQSVTGMIVVSNPACNKTHDHLIHGIEPHCEIKYVPDEKALLREVVDVVLQWDPDILAGYEIEMHSWGYLFQRAFILEMNLCPLLSRVPSARQGNTSIPALDETVVEMAEEITLVGRIMLNGWRLMRHEVALQSYTFENIAFHVLHERVPLVPFKVLTQWWGHRTQLFRGRVADHYLLRVRGLLRIFDQLDLINRTAELARIFGIQFYEVLSRGSQFRVESMMLRVAKPSNYIAVSPSIQQRARMRAPECLQLIMEPESRLYVDPVIVLDFQSLYPSMIIAYNYCYSTCLGRVEHLGQANPFEFGCSRLKVPPREVERLVNHLNISPCGAAFVKANIRKGVLPQMLEEILETRLMVKKSMKEHKNEKTLLRALHSRQLGLKLIANVTYGYTAANFSGRMACVEVGDSVVSKGRETLERAIHLVENTPRWAAQVVYGDTDSLFVLVPGRSREDAFAIGAEIAEAVTQDNPRPVKLKLEKVYQPCMLQTKKRYVGYMYESPDQKDPVYDAKGIETVRRDGCPAVAKVLERSIRLLFETKDVSRVKRYVQRQFSKLLEGTMSLQDLIFAREFRGISGYRPGACVPALELTKRWLQADPRAEPRVGERVPYVVASGPPNVPLIQLVRSPHELLADPGLKVHAHYYVSRVLCPPLDRCFSLIGVDVHGWYADLPRKVNVSLPVCAPATDLKRSTISQYFSTVNCAACSQVCQEGLCLDCLSKPNHTAVILSEKVRMWERNYYNLQKICQSCCGFMDRVECVSLDCPVLYGRRQAWKHLQQEAFLRSLLDQLQ